MKFASMPYDSFAMHIAEDRMLVTAGNAAEWNTMTANWGGIVFLWNRPVVFIFVRPQRYTFGFTENNDTFSLSMFDESFGEVLAKAGAESGRDTDKMISLGLTAREKNGTVVFDEAKKTLICRKLYASDMKKECFTDLSVKEKFYAENDFHRMYAAEIIDVLEK